MRQNKLLVVDAVKLDGIWHVHANDFPCFVPWQTVFFLHLKGDVPHGVFHNRCIFRILKDIVYCAQFPCDHVRVLHVFRNVSDRIFVSQERVVSWHHANFLLCFQHIVVSFVLFLGERCDLVRDIEPHFPGDLPGDLFFQN